MRPTLKILSDKEFDNLPFKHAREALGATDPKRNIVYIRNTGNVPVNTAVLDHEVDELLASTSAHEVDGIRYKKFKDFAANAAGPVLTAIGTAVAGPAGGALGAFAGSKISGNAKKKNSGGALGSAFRTLGTIAGGGLGGSFGSPGSTLGNFFGGGSANPGFIGPLQQGVQRGGVGNFLGNIFGGAGGAPAVASGQSGFGSAGNLLGSLFGGGGGGSSTSNPINAGGTSNLLGNLFGGGGKASASSGGSQQSSGGISSLFGGGGGSNPLNFLLGPLVGGAGNLFAPKVETPDFSGITDPLKSRITGETPSPAFDLGFGEAKRVLDAPLGTVPEEVFAQSERVIDEDLADNLKNLRNTFKSLNPTANVENNSAFVEQSQRLQRDASLAKQNERSRVSFEFTQQELGRRLQTMETVLNLDRSQTEQLIQIAQLEVDEIMLQTGVTFGEAQQVKQLFGDFGQLITESQLRGGGQQQQQQAAAPAAAAPFNPGDFPAPAPLAAPD